VTHCITASIAHAQLPWHRQLHEMVESFALRQLPPQPVAVSGVSSLLSSLLSSIEDAISAQRLLSAHRNPPADADAIGAPVSEEQAPTSNILTNPTTTNTPENPTTSSKSPRERRRGDKKAAAVDLAEAARAKEAASMLATRAAVMSSVSAECLQSLSVEVVCATSSCVGRGSCGASKAAPHDTRPT
jgi:hypothetical protein